MDGTNDKPATEQVLDVFRNEVRATPLLIREHTSLRKQRINRVLNRLRAQQKVTKITTGLYELNQDSNTVSEEASVTDTEENEDSRQNNIPETIDSEELTFENDST